MRNFLDSMVVDEYGFEIWDYIGTKRPSQVGRILPEHAKRLSLLNLGGYRARCRIPGLSWWITCAKRFMFNRIRHLTSEQGKTRIMVRILRHLFWLKPR
jgi:hypothetical protein